MVLGRAREWRCCLRMATVRERQVCGWRSLPAALTARALFPEVWSRELRAGKRQSIGKSEVSLLNAPSQWN